MRAFPAVSRFPVIGDPRTDLRLVIPAIAVWAGMWVVTGWRWGVLVTGAVAAAAGLVALVAGLRRRSGRAVRLPVVLPLLVVVALGSCALVGGLRVYQLAGGPLVRAAGERAVVEADVVIRTARLAAAGDMAVVDAVCRGGVIGGVSYRLDQPVVLLVSGESVGEWLAFPAGSEIGVTARLRPAEAGDGTAAVLTPLGAPRLIRGPPAWQGLIESMRRGLTEAVRFNPAPQAALVPGLVVGETSAMPPAMTADFRATGLTHLVAVSGANLAILLAFLSAIARRIGVRGRGLTVVSVAGIAVFIALCHSEPSVVRAAAMGIVSLAAVGLGGRPGSGLRGLCLAVIALCWIDPWMSRSVGFVLSVLACGGIIAWGGRWAGLLRRWLPGWVAEAMAIPLAAQVATQPVICWLSGSVSVSGLVANAAAAPWVAPATVIGLIAALVSPVSPAVAVGAGYVAGWCAQPILTIATWLAALPGASHPWPATPVGLAVVTAACVAAVRVMPLVLGRVWAVLLATGLLVSAMMVAPFQPGWPGADWRVAACDVGQGDAVVIRAGPGRAILIDVGPADAGVATCLRGLGVRQISLLVLTHFHADHVGGFADVVGAFPVAALLVPTGGGLASDALGLAAERAIPVDRARTGMTTRVDDVTVTVVSAWKSTWSPGDGEESAADNDESLVVRVDTPDMSLLDTGDVEVAGQQAALATGAALQVDVLKVPHHGSARQDPDFLRATKARIALISVGVGNSFGHPADRTVRELVADGMTIARTDQSGSVTISHRDGWLVTSQK